MGSTLYTLCHFVDGDIDIPFGGSRREICFRSSFLSRRPPEPLASRARGSDVPQ